MAVQLDGTPVRAVSSYSRRHVFLWCRHSVSYYSFRQGEGDHRALLHSRLRKRVLVRYEVPQYVRVELGGMGGTRDY